MANVARSFDADRDPRQVDRVVAPSAAPRPEDSPDPSPDLRARFEEKWVKDPRGRKALRYLAQ